MKKSGKRVLAARTSALLIAGALMLLISAPAAPATLAGWVDPEYASASVTTVTVPSLARPTCSTTTPVWPRTAANLTWAPPAGGLPAGMLYEIRANNVPFNPNTTKSRFQSSTSYTFADPSSTPGNDLPDGTVLSVQVFVVIPNSMTTPTAAVWESLSPPTPWQITYDRIDIARGSYSCTGG